MPWRRIMSRMSACRLVSQPSRTRICCDRVSSGGPSCTRVCGHTGATAVAAATARRPTIVQAFTLPSFSGLTALTAAPGKCVVVAGPRVVRRTRRIRHPVVPSHPNHSRPAAASLRGDPGTDGRCEYDRPPVMEPEARRLRVDVPDPHGIERWFDKEERSVQRHWPPRPEDRITCKLKRAEPRDPRPENPERVRTVSRSPLAYVFFTTSATPTTGRQDVPEHGIRGASLTAAAGPAPLPPTLSQRNPTTVIDAGDGAINVLRPYDAFSIAIPMLFGGPRCHRDPIRGSIWRVPARRFPSTPGGSSME
jgi:hypothetical protein